MLAGRFVFSKSTGKLLVRRLSNLLRSRITKVRREFLKPATPSRRLIASSVTLVVMSLMSLIAIWLFGGNTFSHVILAVGIVCAVTFAVGFTRIGASLVFGSLMMVWVTIELVAVFAALVVGGF